MLVGLAGLASCDSNCLQSLLLSFSACGVSVSRVCKLGILYSGPNYSFMLQVRASDTFRYYDYYLLLSVILNACMTLLVFRKLCVCVCGGGGG